MGSAMNMTVRTIAQSLGLNDIQESSFPTIISAVQGRMVTVLSNATQYLHISRRKTLTVDDINNALRSELSQPLFGYGSQSNYRLGHAGTSDSLMILAYEDTILPIDYIVKSEYPPYPVHYYVDFEWVARNGHSKVVEEAEDESLNDSFDNQPSNLLAQKQQSVSELGLEPDIHSISNEMNTFYRLARTDIISDNPLNREQILVSFTHLKSVSTLIPYYIRYAKAIIRDKPNNDHFLTIALRVIYALTINEHNRKETIFHYAHDLITVAMTLLISPDIKIPSVYRLIKLKEFAADYLNTLFELLIRNYPNVQPRACAQLLLVLENKNYRLEDRLGAYIAIEKMGADTLEQHLTPLIGKLVNELQAMLPGADREKRLLINMFFEYMANSVGNIYKEDYRRYLRRKVALLSPRSKTNSQSMYAIFGPKLVELYQIEYSYFSI